MSADKPVDTFKITEATLEQDPAINEAYETYTKTRREFIEAKRAFDQATTSLHELLAPVLPSQRLAKGKHWTLKKDVEDGLIIEIYANEPKRGKSKPQLEVERLSLSPTPKVANARPR
jgi:hypothetical protein